jgi:carbon-monoxide dehydrogenase iron sulfur subunit
MHRAANDMVTNIGGKHACIACGMCVMMCPFGMIARAAVPDEQAAAGSRVIAVKCDLCSDRPVPACAEACPTGAIVFAEADEFAHGSRQRASTVFAAARQVREATWIEATE